MDICTWQKQKIEQIYILTYVPERALTLESRVKQFAIPVNWMLLAGNNSIVWWMLIMFAKLLKENVILL